MRDSDCSFGDGIGINDVDMVVHMGSSKSLLSYWQEVGRCARDGRSGWSIVLYDNLILSLKSTSEDIADVITNAYGNKLLMILPLVKRSTGKPVFVQAVKTVIVAVQHVNVVLFAERNARFMSQFDFIKFLNR